MHADQGKVTSEKGVYCSHRRLARGEVPHSSGGFRGLCPLKENTIMQPYSEPASLRAGGGVWHTLYSGAPLRRYLNTRYDPHLFADATTGTLGDETCGRLKYYRFANRSDKPSGALLILLPGWLGTVDSGYLRMALTRVRTANTELVLLMPRDHNDTYHLNTERFSPAYLDDLLHAISELQSLTQCRQTMLAGFSLGGNFAIRLASQLGKDISAVLAICPMIRPAESTPLMDTKSRLLRLYFLTKWHRSALHKHRCFPDVYPYPQDLLATKSIMALTEIFVRETGRYRSTADYFEAYTITSQLLKKVAASVSIAHSSNDPIIPQQHIQSLAEHAQVSIQAGGGHCGFLYGLGPQSWCADLLVEFAEDHACGRNFKVS